MTKVIIYVIIKYKIKKEKVHIMKKVLNEKQMALVAKINAKEQAKKDFFKNFYKNLYAKTV